MKRIGEMIIRVRRGSLGSFGEAVGEEGGDGEDSGVLLAEMLKKGSVSFLRRRRVVGGEGGGLGGRGE